MAGIDADKFWNDVTGRLAHLPRAAHFVGRMKQDLPRLEVTENDRIPIEDGDPYEKAVEMLAAKIEEIYLTEQLERARRRHKIREGDFWLAFVEHHGTAGEDRLVFDPSCTVVVQRPSKPQTPPPSYRATLHEFAELVECALHHPVAAGGMAQDARLPSWLREMARAITTGNLAPTLREVIEECLADPEAARGWRSRYGDDGGPDWLVELTEILGARRKWEL